MPHVLLSRRAVKFHRREVKLIGPTYNASLLCKLFANGSGIFANKCTLGEYHKSNRSREQLGASR